MKIAKLLIFFSLVSFLAVSQKESPHSPLEIELGGGGYFPFLKGTKLTNQNPELGGLMNIGVTHYSKYNFLISARYSQFRGTVVTTNKVYDVFGQIFNEKLEVKPIHKFGLSVGGYKKINTTKLYTSLGYSFYNSSVSYFGEEEKYGYLLYSKYFGYDFVIGFNHAIAEKASLDFKVNYSQIVGDRFDFGDHNFLSFTGGISYSIGLPKPKPYEDKEKNNFFSNHRFQLSSGFYLPIFSGAPARKLNPNISQLYSINYSFSLNRRFILGFGYRRIFENKVSFDDPGEIYIASLGGTYSFHLTSYIIPSLNTFSIDLGYKLKQNRLEFIPKLFLLTTLSDYHEYDDKSSQWSDYFKIDPIDLAFGLDVGYHLNKLLILTLSSFSNITPISAKETGLYPDNYPKLYLPSINVGLTYKLN